MSSSERLRAVRLRIARRPGLAIQAAAIVLATLLSCASQPAPPINEPAASTYLPGKFVWHALFTDDVAGAQTFYGQLLGWTFLTVSENPDYVLIRSEGRPVAAIVEVTPPSGGKWVPQWLRFLSVDDVDAAAKQCEKDGRLYKGPFTVPGIGHVAIVADPLGAPLALVRSESGDPADGREPKVGEWIWRDYVATNPDSAAAFYGSLVGYKATAVEGAPIDYRIFDAGGMKRAGIVKNPWTNVHSNWLPSVRVADAVATADKAKSLGAEIVLAPRSDVRNSSFAIVTDPRNAAVALQRYPF
jgi:hypothetical protein